MKLCPEAFVKTGVDPFVFYTLRIFLGVLILLTGTVASAQKIKPEPHPPLDADDQSSLQVPPLKMPFDLELTYPELPKELNKERPFAVQAEWERFMLTNMPILHPELNGYRMPIHRPSGDLDYSLLILPFNPPLKLPEKD